MEIRVCSELAGSLKLLAQTFKREVTITVDENAKIPVFFAKNNVTGELREVLRGEKEIESLLQHGYNKIIKFCPYLKKNCIGEGCQLYIVDGITGDCAFNWTAILTLDLLRRNAG